MNFRKRIGFDGKVQLFEFTHYSYIVSSYNIESKWYLFDCILYTVYVFGRFIEY